MRRGCIVTGEIKCDGCHRLVEQGEQYLVFEEHDDEKLCFCIDCCLSKGYAVRVADKDEQMVTFFPSELDS